MTNIVGFAWESALFALRNHTMQPRKEMTLMQPKLPQAGRHNPPFPAADAARAEHLYSPAAAR